MKSLKTLVLIIVLSLNLSILKAGTTDPLVLLETSEGNIVIRCYQTQSPKTVENFLMYVEDGFYDNTLFHRVIDGFMIQGGGFDVDMAPKPTREPIKNESYNTIKNTKYRIAMALTTDLNSATSQFFINLKDNEHLDYNSTKNKLGYTVFGEIMEGQSVVDKIKKVKTIQFSFLSPESNRKIIFEDVPEKQIVIKKASILRR